MICELFGCSRQAFYQAQKTIEILNINHSLILSKVKSIRANHQKMGTRKLYHKMQDFFIEHNIKMGRDALFNLLSDNDLLIKKRKRKMRTTFTYTWLKKYPNLTIGLLPKSINELWVADITYLSTEFGPLYMHLITDAYSHKVVGYNIAENLKAIETQKALKMAISSFSFLQNKSRINLVHYSTGTPSQR